MQKFLLFNVKEFMNLVLKPYNNHFRPIRKQNHRDGLGWAKTRPKAQPEGVFRNPDLSCGFLEEFRLTVGNFKKDLHLPSPHTKTHDLF